MSSDFVSFLNPGLFPEFLYGTGLWLVTFLSPRPHPWAVLSRAAQLYFLAESRVSGT